MKNKKYLDIWTARLIGAESDKEFRAKLDKNTETKLRETVMFCRNNSIYYKELYDGLEIPEDNFMKWFETLPFSTPEDARERHMDFICVRPGDISRVVTINTGGSTGKPKRVHFTQEDQQLTVDFFHNGMQLIVDATDKVMILMPAKVPGSIGLLLSEALHGFGAQTVEYGLPDMFPGRDGSDEEVERILKIIAEENVTSVVALPTHMRMLAEKAHGHKLKSVLLSAEYVSDENMQFIGETFGCKMYEHYGMTEMGLGCAVSCGYGEGYHVRESDLYIEIIDPETGVPVPEGEIGEVVFTTLTRKGMPFVRYRTGDYSRWITEQCACGSQLKRLAKVGPRAVVKGYLKKE